MDSNLYEIGVYLSLLYWLYQSIFLIILINSQMEKNLNKSTKDLVGLHLELNKLNHMMNFILKFLE